MSLFEFDAKDKVTVSPEIKRIKIFQELLDGDNADNIAAFIFHSSDWKSPYQDMLEDEREKELRIDFLNGKKPTKKIIEACEKYKKLSETPSLTLLQSAKKGARSLQQYFEEADPSSSDNPGREAKDLMFNLQKVGELLNKFIEWEEMILKEKDKANTRKGVKMSKYNSTS